MRSALIDQNGNFVSASNPLPTQLTGRNIEQVYFHNALAITDTNIKQSLSIDLTKYREIYFFARSSLDQPVDVYLNIENAITTVWNNGAWDATNERKITLPASGGSRIYLLNTARAWLNGKIKTMRIDVGCNAAPTSGSVTVYVMGVPN